MIVIDASAVVDVLTDREPGVAVALEMSEHKELWAPELMMVEVTSALWRLTRTGLLKAADADRAVARLGRLPVTLLGHRPLLTDAWAYRQSLRISDAFYVACSRRLGLPLLTTDGRLARAVGKGIDVRLVT